MINFIIVDDNKKFLEIMINVVTKVMMKNKFVYKTYSFNEYDDEFFATMNSDMSNKIYILDIETREASGIDIARKIRKRDVDSVIIFATVHNEAGLVLLKDDLMFLTFLCKFDDFENNLYSSVYKALDYIHHDLSIKFNDRGTFYNVPVRDILYITKESGDRKSTIKTSYASYRVNLTLKELFDLSCENLIQTHRCCFVNMDNVRVFDRKKNTILFDNGEVIDLVSDKYKKGIEV